MLSRGNETFTLILQILPHLQDLCNTMGITQLKFEYSNVEISILPENDLVIYLENDC